jgi:phosphate-selective porin OprO/OprP
MILGFQKSFSWAVLGALLLLTPVYPLHAMDEETTKTITALQAQMKALIDQTQVLMNEVKSLKAQSTKPQSPNPTSSSPSTVSNSTPAESAPGSTAPLPDQANRPLMELPQGGSTESASTRLQEGDKGRLKTLDISDKGAVLRSEDGRHSIRLGGLLQVDDREFTDEGSGQASKMLLRRARPYASGYFYDDWNYRFAEEFALSAPNATTYQATISEAFINYKPIEDIQVESGKYKPPVALEQLVIDPLLIFNERALTSNLSPARDVGIMTHGLTADGKLSWAAMVGTGARNNNLSTGLDYDTGYTGYFRLFAQPFKDEKNLEPLAGLKLGLGGSIQWQDQALNGTQITSNLFQNYSTDGGNTFYTFPNGLDVQGEHWRISPQIYYSYKNFGFLGEYICEKQGVDTSSLGAGGGFTSYQTDSWNASLNYIITGEEATLDGVIPNHPVDFKSGDWGAWEVALRYDGIALGDTMFSPVNQGGMGASRTDNATGVNGFSGALNWYINRLIRLGVTIEYNAFTGGGGLGTVVENNEFGFLTRIQILY